MSEWNPASVEDAIQKTVERLEKGVKMVDEAYRAFQKADLDYDIAEAKAFLRAEGSVDARKKQTVLETVEQRIARDAADADYRVMEKNGKALERKLDALRSIGSSVRQAYAQGIGT